MTTRDMLAEALVGYGRQREFVQEFVRERASDAEVEGAWKLLKVLKPDLANAVQGTALKRLVDGGAVVRDGDAILWRAANMYYMARRMFDGQLSTHTLNAACTDVERLRVHWEGFVEIAREFAA